MSSYGLPLATVILGNVTVRFTFMNEIALIAINFSEYALPGNARTKTPKIQLLFRNRTVSQ